MFNEKSYIKVFFNIYIPKHMFLHNSILFSNSFLLKLSLKVFNYLILYINSNILLKYI